MSCDGCGFDRYDLDPHAFDCPTMRAQVIAEANSCQYSFACEREATTIIDAPAIRDRFPYGVPACEKCANFVERIK
jgi:hypothetical protein